MSEVIGGDWVFDYRKRRLLEAEINQLRTNLDAAETEIARLRDMLRRSAERIEPLVDGEEVVWIGCYVLKWNKVSSPSIGFRPWPDDFIEPPS